jgi:hypothetical protein
MWTFNPCDLNQSIKLLICSWLTPDFTTAIIKTPLYLPFETKKKPPGSDRAVFFTV